jgi:hypothetical protein
LKLCPVPSRTASLPVNFSQRLTITSV